MRQPSQKYSIKDDQKKRLNTNHLAQQVLAQDQKLLTNLESHHPAPQKQHDLQTQQIYDMMNFQSKQVGNNSISNGGGGSSVNRQLNLKMTLVQKQILNNNGNNPNKIGGPNTQITLMSSVNQHNMNNQDDNTITQQQNHPHYSQLTSNINNSGNSITSGSFFRQAALSQFQQREQSNHSPEQQIQSSSSPFYQSGFDNSDRSTTANTGFPHFSSKASTFQRKLTQGSTQLSTNNQQINLNSSNYVHLDNIQQQNQNSNGNSQINMPQIGGQIQNNNQGSKLRGINQISKAYRQLHVNDQSSDNNNSLPRNNFQIQNEIIQIGGQNISNKNGIQSYLTIEKIKSLDKNTYQNQGQLTNQSNLGLLSGNNSSLQNIGIGFIGHNSGQNSISITNNINNNNNSNNNQQEKSYHNDDFQSFHAHPSVIGSHKQSSPLQKYIHSRQRNSDMQQKQSILQQALPASLNSQQQNINNQNDSSEIQNNFNKKDLKIRKGFQVQQKIQKPSNLRFQTAQFILDSQQQQQQSQNQAINQQKIGKDKTLYPQSFQQQNQQFQAQQQQQHYNINNNFNNNHQHQNYNSNNSSNHQTINNNSVLLQQLHQQTNNGSQSNTQSKSDLNSKIAQVNSTIQNIEVNQSRQVRKLTDSISIQNLALKQQSIPSTQLNHQNNLNHSNIINNRNLQVSTRNLNTLDNTYTNESDTEISVIRKRNNVSGEGSGNNSRTRKITNGTDKEQIILKTLNLEERKRLIKKHQTKQNIMRHNNDEEEDIVIMSYQDNIQAQNIAHEINQQVEKDQFEKENGMLDIIEEETMNDDIKSYYSKIQAIQKSKSRVISQSFTNLSSRIIDNNLYIPLVQKNNLQQLVSIYLLIYFIQILQRSPAMNKFKKAMFKSEAFKIIYKKIKDGIIKKSTPEYEKIIDNLSKISGMSQQEVELCVDVSLQQKFSERFQNPYNKMASSSQDTIEENIASVSFNHSFTYGNVPIIARSGDQQSLQPSSGSSIWHQPLGFGNIVNGINQSKNDGGMGGSYKIQKNGEVIEEFKQAVLDFKSNSNNSDKRSNFSKKLSNQKTGSESFTSGSREYANKRRLGNLRSTGSHQSNDQLIYKVNVNKSIESNSGSQVNNESTNQQSQFSPNINNFKVDEKDSSQKRSPLHQVQQQQQNGISLEHIKLRNQSLQPKINDSLNVQKVQIAEKQGPNLKGQLVRWKELKKIGQGTQGEVFIAQNVKNFNFFVVKKLSLFSVNSGIDKEALMKLKVSIFVCSQQIIQKEIEVYRKLDHQNVIKYIGSEIVNNQFCIYLEYMSSGSLQTVYQNYGNLQESTIKAYTKQILNGLIYLHHNKVIHCDLKGANVLVDHNGVVKLSDFGCAKLFESSFSMSDFNGAIRGSLPWMAPEVVMNKGIRRKADIWSLGCLMIELAVGGNPWGNQLSSNNFQAIFKIADPNSYPTVPENLSLECQDFIKKCLIRDYELRPSAQDLLEHVWLREE